MTALHCKLKLGTTISFQKFKILRSISQTWIPSKEEKKSKKPDCCMPFKIIARQYCLIQTLTDTQGYVGVGFLLVKVTTIAVPPSEPITFRISRFIFL